MLLVSGLLFLTLLGRAEMIKFGKHYAANGQPIQSTQRPMPQEEHQLDGERFLGQQQIYQLPINVPQEMPAAALKGAIAVGAPSKTSQPERLNEAKSSQQMQFIAPQLPQQQQQLVSLQQPLAYLIVRPINPNTFMDTWRYNQAWRQPYQPQQSLQLEQQQQQLAAKGSSFARAPEQPQQLDQQELDLQQQQQFEAQQQQQQQQFYGNGQPYYGGGGKFKAMLDKILAKFGHGMSSYEVTNEEIVGPQPVQPVVVTVQPQQPQPQQQQQFAPVPPLEQQRIVEADAQREEQRELGFAQQEERPQVQQQEQAVQLQEQLPERQEQLKAAAASQTKLPQPLPVPMKEEALKVQTRPLQVQEQQQSSQAANLNQQQQLRDQKQAQPLRDASGF